jgi:hypothetical protein
MATKVIVTNGQALEAKYGERADEVWQAVKKLIGADAERGIETRLEKLGDGWGSIDVGDRWPAFKEAVDMVFRELRPDYLMLLGGPDVIPHCELDNPAGDDDPIVPSDIPYACEAGVSTDPAEYIAPTRVVSRLPDVPGATDPEALLRILQTATEWRRRGHAYYLLYLGITAEVWTGSTQLTLTQLFGDAKAMQVSPPNGPEWEPGLLRRYSHFANLHGAARSTQYYGQEGSEFPIAHDAALVEGNLEEGTIASVEACYGAELFEPEGQLPMPFAYLVSGAYGFFGSSTISYGPSDSTDFADVICRLFHAAVLNGASIGRAGLEARQEYVSQQAPLDPIDLKTLAQFLILGDPSVQPVYAISDWSEDVSDEVAAAVAKVQVTGVSERRQLLRRRGDALGQVASWAQPLEGEPDAKLVEVLREVAGLPDGDAKVSSFTLAGGPEAKTTMRAGSAGPKEPATMHLLMQSVEQTGAPAPQHVAVVAVEAGGQLVSAKTALSR